MTRTRFDFFVHFLYRGTIPFHRDNCDPKGNAEYLLWAKTHVLGHMLGDSDFLKATTAALSEQISLAKHKDSREARSGIAEIIRYIYEETVETDKDHEPPARMYLVNIFMHHGRRTWLLNFNPCKRISHLTLRSSFSRGSKGY